jgi:hypothetical protein
MYEAGKSKARTKTKTLDKDKTKNKDRAGTVEDARFLKLNDAYKTR